MFSIDLDKATPGMVLAKAVYTPQDALLLKPDVQLTEKNIHILKSWGIQHVSVVGTADDGETAQPNPENELRSSIDEELRIKFSDTLPDPVMEEIMRIAGNLLEKRLSKKEK